MRNATLAVIACVASSKASGRVFPEEAVNGFVLGRQANLKETSESKGACGIEATSISCCYRLVWATLKTDASSTILDL